MRETSKLWEALREKNANVEYKWEIEGETYGADAEISHSVSLSLFEDFGIGNATIAKLTLHIVAEEIPRGAKIQRYVRRNDGDSVTEWMPAGVFWTNRRSCEEDEWTVEAYDAMRRADAVFLEEGDPEVWPRPLSEVMNEICTRIGVTLDSRTVLQNYSVAYPNDLTMREILGHIATAHCGNFVITGSGTLYLVPLIPKGTADDLGEDFVDCADNGKREPISRVTIWYADEEAVSVGDDTGLTLQADCPWITTEIASSILEAVKGYSYQAFSATAVNVDPAHELGDPLLLGGLSCIIAKIEDDGSGFPDISAPGSLEDKDEYPDEGPLQKELGRTVKLGQDYYGTSIDRTNGLTVQRINALGGVNARAVFNSDELSFYNESGAKVLYFDPATGKFKFVGDVDVQNGSININDKFVVDENGDVKMSGKSSIYGGKYYAGDPEDDKGYSEMTSSGFQVINALGQLKLLFGYTSSEYDYPFIELGSGDNSSGSKGLLKKFQDGLWIGNNAPKNASGVFSPRSDYIGLFFSFTDNAAYVVSGRDMSNIYTGDAIAKFG